MLFTNFYLINRRKENSWINFESSVAIFLLSIFIRDLLIDVLKLESTVFETESFEINLKKDKKLKFIFNPNLV